MTDREKVLTQLAEIGIGLDMAGYHDDAQCVRDAMALLREQEPVEPIVERINELDSLFRCGGCGAYVLFRKQRYCHACGREVKWDG